MSKIFLDKNWLFSEEFKEEYISSAITDGQVVNVPHTVKEVAYNYFDEHDYQMVSCYQKNIKYDKAWEGKNLYLVFEAVGHKADIYINGEHKKCHKNGYNAFSVYLNQDLRYGEKNLLTVKVNSREDINQPPFGFVIDYNTEAVYNAGSAIFFHVSYNPTAGCVGTDREMVLQYLSKLDAYKHPYIIIV